MYREKIRDHYDSLSRSYRRVADYILSNYYEVAFLTAAQLASVVKVDTTTVVRFSQRLGYEGYPDLLADIRDQVKAEIYAVYEPQELTPDDPAATFKSRTDQEHENLSQMLVHNPPEHIRAVMALFDRTRHILLIAEGYAGAAAEMIAQQLRHRGLSAEAADQDVVKRAATLMHLAPDTLVIGISATPYADDVARALEFARRKGCPTLGVVGSLANPINRMSDLVVYAPTDVTGPIPSMVALVAALSALAQVASKDSPASVEQYQDEFDEAYRFLIQRQPEATEDD